MAELLPDALRCPACVGAALRAFCPECRRAYRREAQRRSRVRRGGVARFAPGDPPMPPARRQEIAVQARLDNAAPRDRQTRRLPVTAPPLSRAEAGRLGGLARAARKETGC